MVDLHLHTKISYDSSELPENYIRAAKERGDKIITFCEHYDLDEFLESGGPLPDLSEYSSCIARLRENFPDMKILKGIELGYSADAADKLRKVVKEGDFDCVLLSVHTLKGRGDCYYPRFFEGFSKEQAYSAYLLGVLESIKSGIDFDVVAHIGYVARYAPYDDRILRYSQFSAIIDEILGEIISRGKCLEINSSASGSGESTIPPREIIQRYNFLGGKYISFGSDAHTAADYKRGESEIKPLLKSLGYEKCCYFEGRKRKFFEI